VLNNHWQQTIFAVSVIPPIRVREGLRTLLARELEILFETSEQRVQHIMMDENELSRSVTYVGFAQRFMMYPS
jgi:hypothetical protein